MGRMMENLDPTLMARIEKEGVGPFLRRAREGKDVPLRSISEQTRIRTYYLESIENGDFDKLPTGPVGLGFVRAFADAVGVDAKAVAASYKREITGGVPLKEYGLEPETRILFNAAPRVNRFSSVATFVFVLIFLLAGGGLLWFMKGRTEQLVPIGSIVDRVKTAVAPKADKLPLVSGVNEKAKHEDGAEKETTVVERKASEQTLPPASTVNLKEPPVVKKEEKPSPAAASAPAGENPVAEKPASAQESSVARESPPAQGEESPPVQANAQTQETPGAQEEPSPTESPPASQNPSAQVSAPAEEKVARNAASNTQASAQGRQATAAPGELPLALKIFATEDTWLRIVVDAKNTEEFLLLAGKERNWKASEKFVLTVGNVAGAQISLNGAEVALPKNDSNVLRDFIITKKYLN